MTATTTGSPAPAVQQPVAGTSPDAGWAMLPHSIAADARLTAVDIRVALALLYFARSKHTCTPCDQSIGERGAESPPEPFSGRFSDSNRFGTSAERVGRAVGPRNRTGRVLHLLWKTEGAVPRDRMSDRRSVAPRSPAHRQRKRCRRRGEFEN